MYAKDDEAITLLRPLVVTRDEAKSTEAVSAVSLDAMAQEAIAMNLEAALRVYSEQHFFSWTQGLLQSLIRHEVLLCCLRKGDNELSRIEGFATESTEPHTFGNLFRQDAALAEKLIKAWENGHFRPLIRDLERDPLFAASPLAREFIRLGATRVIAHGTHDANGRMVSFFVFACRENDAHSRQAHLVDLLVPFLHASWIRSKVSLSKTGTVAASAGNMDLLTAREQEVLQWVYLGKSNIEIGIILGISQLTVKNHVQEILRRLNVQNRAQAVGKAFNLHILTC